MRKGLAWEAGKRNVQIRRGDGLRGNDIPGGTSGMRERSEE